MPMPAFAPVERPAGGSEPEVEVDDADAGADAGGDAMEGDDGEADASEEDGVFPVVDGAFVAEDVCVDDDIEDEDEDEEEAEESVKFLGSNVMGRYSMLKPESSLQQSWVMPQHHLCDPLPAARLQGVRKGYLSVYLTLAVISSTQSRMWYSHHKRANTRPCSNLGSCNSVSSTPRPRGDCLSSCPPGIVHSAHIYPRRPYGLSHNRLSTMDSKSPWSRAGTRHSCQWCRRGSSILLVRCARAGAV